MLRIASFLIKMILFSVAVLVLGNVLHWQGRTLSDEVKLQMAHAERAGYLESITGWAKKLSYETQKGFQVKNKYFGLKEETTEEMSSSERAKLKALIQELNRSHGKD